jgi:hypothetical protein
MADTPNRRAASAAARDFLQAKVDRVGDIAEATRAIDAAVEARTAADRHIIECQRAYSQTRRAAIAAGWTDNQLDQLGWPPEYGPQPQPQRRRRPAPSRLPTQPAAAPETSTADAGAPAAVAAPAGPAQRGSRSASGHPSGTLPDSPVRNEAPGLEAVFDSKCRAGRVSAGPRRLA